MRRFLIVVGLWGIGCGGAGDGSEGSSGGGGSSGGATGTGTGDGSTAIPTTGEVPTGSTSSGEAETTGGTTTAGTTAVTTEGGSESTTGTVLPPMSLEDVVDGEPEAIREALNFPEGPVWSVEGGYLLFSDIGGNTIYKWTEGEGSAAFIMPSDMSNGLDFDGAGRILAAEHATRRVSRRSIGEDAETIVDDFEGLKLNSPNDLVIASDGSIYFTDPPYGIDPNQQELDFQGVFWIDPQGELVVLADDFDRPNGIVLSPDESTLYVDDTAKEHVRRFAVQPDGNAFGGEVFVDLQSDAIGDPDGMTVDEFGDLYVTGGGGVRVVTPAGEVLGVIAVPESATNCTFGGVDGRELFITAPPKVYRVAMKVKGVGF